MFVEGRVHGPGVNVLIGHVLPTQKCPLSTFLTLPPFNTHLHNYFFLFLVVSFCQCLEEAVSFKGSWYTSACKFACGEDWYTTTFRLW